MVEYNPVLDIAYYSLSDPTRRDILMRVSKEELPIKTLAANYNMSFAAVAKHIQVLADAHLVNKRRSGKEQRVSASQETIKLVKDNLGKFEEIWNERFKALDEVLSRE